MPERSFLRAAAAPLALAAIWLASVSLGSGAAQGGACAAATGLRDATAVDCFASSHPANLRSEERLFEGQGGGPRLPREILLGWTHGPTGPADLADAARLRPAPGAASDRPPSPVLATLVSSGKTDLPPPVL